jgi:hypothetical protein
MKYLLFIAVLLGGHITQAQNTPSTSQKDEKQMIHHVYFSLKNPDSVQDKQLLKEGLQSLAAIQEVKHLIIGEPAPTFDREVIASDWHVSEVIYFDSVADQDAYQVDPVHQLFVTNYSHLWSKVVVYDILVD